MKKTALSIFTLLIAQACLSAEVRLHHLFQDHMVLQRDVKLPIFGWAGSGEEILVTLNGQSRQTKADEDGHWRVELDAQPAGGPFDLTIQGKNVVTLHDLLIGDVWVCAGQSNMASAMSRDGDPNDIAQVNIPFLRLFKVAGGVSYKPKEDVQGTWMMVTPESVSGFSAVGFYFGRDIQQHLNIPIGLIQSAEGGTKIQSWIYHETLASHARFKPEIDEWQKQLSAFPDYATRFDEYFGQWWKDFYTYVEQRAKYEEGLKKTRAEGKPDPTGAPVFPEGPFYPRKNPSLLYAGMIAPLTGFPIKGVLWYQGESNVGKPYGELLKIMINAWRSAWKSPELPFVIVQLPRFGAASTQPEESATWAALREEQFQVANSDPNVGVSVNIDLGDMQDIHPKPKRPYGEHAALVAREKIYNEKVESRGPVFKKIAIEENRARIYFDHIGSGLLIPEGQPLKGFAIAGDDGKFTWAEAKVDGDSVVVWSESIPAPKYVRYAWANYPSCNLFSKEGLPAAPFRTDNYPTN